MIKIVVSVQPILECQITEDIRRLRNKNLSDGILESLNLFAASILGHGFGPDTWDASEGRDKGFEHWFHRGAKQMKDWHVDKSGNFCFFQKTFLNFDVTTC